MVLEGISLNDEIGQTNSPKVENRTPDLPNNKQQG
jgi:hypothetical protein